MCEVASQSLQKHLWEEIVHNNWLNKIVQVKNVLLMDKKLYPFLH